MYLCQPQTLQGPTTPADASTRRPPNHDLSHRGQRACILPCQLQDVKSPAAWPLARRTTGVPSTNRAETKEADEQAGVIDRPTAPSHEARATPAAHRLIYECGARLNSDNASMHDQLATFHHLPGSRLGKIFYSHESPAQPRITRPADFVARHSLPWRYQLCPSYGHSSSPRACSLPLLPLMDGDPRFCFWV